MSFESTGSGLSSSANESIESTRPSLSPELVKSFRKLMADDNVSDDDNERYYDGFMTSAAQAIEVIRTSISEKLLLTAAPVVQLTPNAMLDQSPLYRAIAGSSGTTKELSNDQKSILAEAEMKITDWWNQYYDELDEKGRGFWKKAARLAESENES